MSERNTRYKLDVLVALRDGTDPRRRPAWGGGADCAAWWSTLAGWLEGIAMAEHQLRVEQALRTVIVASPEDMTVRQQSAPILAPAAQG